MNLTFRTFGWKWELGRREITNRDFSPFTVPDAAEAESRLRRLLAQEKDMHRLRIFFSQCFVFRNLADWSDSAVIAEIARQLHRGTLWLVKSKIVERPTFARVKRAEEEVQEQEDWVEMEATPPPEEHEPDFAVSHETGLAMAETNRDLAASGTPLKSLCANGDCEVCKGQVSLAGAS